MREHGAPVGILVRCETSQRLACMEKVRAIKSTAHEIARVVYAMWRHGTECVQRSIANFEKAHQNHKIAHIRRQAHATAAC